MRANRELCHSDKVAIMCYNVIYIESISREEA